MKADKSSLSAELERLQRTTAQELEQLSVLAERHLKLWERVTDSEGAVILGPVVTPRGGRTPARTRGCKTTDNGSAASEGKRRISIVSGGDQSEDGNQQLEPQGVLSIADEAWLSVVDEQYHIALQKNESLL